MKPEYLIESWKANAARCREQVEWECYRQQSGWERRSAQNTTRSDTLEKCAKELEEALHELFPIS